MTAPLNQSPVRRVRVLIAEDSATIRWHLTKIINELPGLEVIGEARNGAEVLEMVPRLRPDVVSMDISMPLIDGLEATRRLMMHSPVPVVIVSSLIEQDVDLAMQAIQAGALAVVEKPPDRQHPAFLEKQRQLGKTLSAMAGVRVIRRSTGILSQEEGSPEKRTILNSAYSRPIPELIAIGASAGGPSALNDLLRELPSSLPVPVVIVQHMPHEFIGGLARWLQKSSSWPVTVLRDGQRIEPGAVYIAPGTAHLALKRQFGILKASLIDERGGYHHQPAVDVLFDSVAEVLGPAAVGVILTGMGEDGANGLLKMRQAGAYTFAQDQASSTVFGMPGTAIARGAVEHVLSLGSLSTAIIKLL
jgi:two-component system, chemotaxis family, protein-glutamate methylesterase/glutaminase